MESWGIFAKVDMFWDSSQLIFSQTLGKTVNSSMTVHMTLMHSVEKKFQCDKCDYQVIYYEALTTNLFEDREFQFVYICFLPSN